MADVPRGRSSVVWAIAAIGAVVVGAVAATGLVASRRDGSAGGGSDAISSVPFVRHVIDGADLGADVKAVGDVSADGRLDVVVGDDSGTPLTWYQAPDWTPHVIDDRSVFTTDVQLADVDADGDLDVVVPDYPAGEVLWYANPGNGDGEWAMVTIGRADVHDLATGDVDGDGLVDVVVRGHGGPTVLFRQEGPGTWTRVELPAPLGEGLALGDLDRDGDLDVVQNGWWLEAPTDLAAGEWVRHDFADGWPETVAAQVVDLDGDGGLDVLLAPNETDGRMTWYRAPSDPRGPDWIPHEIGDVEDVHRTGVADVDLDGDLDVVFAEQHQSPTRRVGWFRNEGDGSAWSVQVIADSGSHNIATVDFDGDGDADVVGANHDGTSPLEWWENRRTDALGNWERTVVDDARPERAVFVLHGDLDGDGHSDLVSGAWWYRNPGETGAPWARSELGEGLSQAAVVVDVDGDGDLDVIGTRGEGVEPNATFSWAEGDGRGTFTVHAGVAEADGDFLGGAVARRFDPGGPLEVALSWHEGPGTQMLTVPEDPVQPWTWRQISPVTQTNGLDAGDVDGDGDDDLLLGTRWLRNDGDGRWSDHDVNVAAGENADRPVLVDVNGDGRLDAVVGFEVISEPGKLAWYQAPADPATTTWTEHVIADDVIGPMSVDVADIDGDGDVDVAVGEHNLAAPDEARLFVFEQAVGPPGGMPVWTRHQAGGGDEHHDGAQLVDVDDDGDLDVVSIGWGHPRVLLYENLALRGR